METEEELTKEEIENIISVRALYDFMEVLKSHIIYPHHVDYNKQEEVKKIFNDIIKNIFSNLDFLYGNSGINGKKANVNTEFINIFVKKSINDANIAYNDYKIFVFGFNEKPDPFKDFDHYYKEAKQYLNVHTSLNKHKHFKM